MPLAILTIIATTCAWKYNLTEYVYVGIALLLLITFQKKAIRQKNIFLTIAFFAPLTIIIIKERILHISKHNTLLQKNISAEGIILTVRPSFDRKISTFCTVGIQKIIYRDEIYFVDKKIHLFLPTKIRIKSQQKIFLENIVIKPPTEGSYKIFCLQELIWGAVYATPKNYTLQHTAESRQISIFEKISRKLSLKAKILFNLIFIGQKDAGYISQTVRHQSLYWGVSHIIARSGMHLSIIFLLIFCMLMSLPLPYRYKLILTIISVACFFIATPQSTSFNRAFLMIIVYLLSQIHNVLHSGLHALTTITFFILLYNPFIALSLGFQLSFGITYIIIKALSRNRATIYCFKR
jgi:ComEC/Rec2-related protein